MRQGLADLKLSRNELVVVLQGVNHPIEASAPVLRVQCGCNELGSHGDVAHRLLLALLQLLLQDVTAHGGCVISLSSLLVILLQGNSGPRRKGSMTRCVGHAKEPTAKKKKKKKLVEIHTQKAPNERTSSSLDRGMGMLNRRANPLRIFSSSPSA